MAKKSPSLEFIEVENMLQALARSFLMAQKDLDRKSLDLARKFIELDNVGFSFEENAIAQITGSASGEIRPVLPLHSLVSFRRYHITELLVEFGVITEGKSKSNNQTRLRIVSFGSQAEYAQPACIKVVKNGTISAEFQIAGETKAVVFLDE